MQINDRIVKRRSDLGLSQVALAKLVGVSSVSVSKWESGLNQPKGRYLNDLADALNVTVDWLLNGNEKSKQVKALMAKLGLTRKAVANLVGVKEETVARWEEGFCDPTADAFLAMRNLFEAMPELATPYKSGGSGVPPELMLREHPHPHPYHSPSEHANVEIAVLPVGQRIPVISYVQAGQWHEMRDATTFDGNVEFVQAGTDTGPMAFALWLTGDSMLPLFKEGDLIIVDPDVQPSPGDFVVAKNGSHEATFKKYRPRGYDDKGQEVFELVPLNDDFPTLRSDVCPIFIVGTMVEHRSFRKKSGGR